MKWEREKSGDRPERLRRPHHSRPVPWISNIVEYDVYSLHSEACCSCEPSQPFRENVQDAHDLIVA